MTRKIKHNITTKQRHGGQSLGHPYSRLIRHAVQMGLDSEDVDLPCAVNVLITDDSGITKYNKKYRGIDKATDVLSFPMQEFESAGWNGIADIDSDPDSQTVPLGDIVISVTTIKRNARRHRNTFEQETVRMIFHSVLHILGYDHSIEMEKKEKKLMEQMGYFSTDDIVDWEWERF